MREKKLASNSIASYVRVLSAFLSWARKEGLSVASISAYKAEETVKDAFLHEAYISLCFSRLVPQSLPSET